MANQIISNLTRTLSMFFRFGNLRLKDESGTLVVRNGADTANADLAANKIRVRGSNSSNAVVLDAPGSLAGTVTFVLPGADGASGQYLRTNGAGTMEWGDPGSDADKTTHELFTEATSSPLTIFTPPANGVLRQITIAVTQAAAGGSPVVKVGTAADDDAYMLASESDLKDAGMYTVYPMANVGASPAPVILTISPAGQTFQGAVYITYSIPS